MKQLAIILMSLFAMQAFAATQSKIPTGEQIRQQRLQEEADQIIHPAPMKTEHSDSIHSVSGGSYPPMESKGFEMKSVSKHSGVKTKHPEKKAASSSKKQPQSQKAMTYYQALLKCKKGTYTYDNPFNTAVKGHSSITNQIKGQKMGFCQVNIEFSNRSTKLQCLFSHKNLKALSAKKAVLAFKNTYVKGHYDQHHMSLYDEVLSNVCLQAS